MREFIITAENRLGKFVVGEAILMLAVGTLSLVAYLVIGLPYALLLGIVAGLMEAVPLIGPGLGAIPAALVAYSVEPSLVIWVIVATLAIQQIENNVLVPRIMERTVGVHPLTTLLAFVALSSLFGVVGALVAVPLAAVVQLVFNRFLLDPDALLEKELAGRGRLSVLRYETQELVRDVRKQARAHADIPGSNGGSESFEDELEAIAKELDDILKQNGEGSSEGS